MSAVAVLLLALLFPGAPEPDSRADAKPLINNERVNVRELTWIEGKPAPVQQPKYDSVSIFLVGEAIRQTMPDGTSKVITVKAGDALFERKGSTYGEEGAAAKNPARAIVIELKDHPVQPLRNTSGYPNAFPRPRVKKVMENDRVIVWDYTWTPGVPTPMHFHDKDVVVVYMENGALKSTAPNGQSVVNDVSFGMTRFNARDRVHSEELVKGNSRAIIMELK